MAVIIPEVVLYNLVSGILKYVRSNYENSTTLDKSDTILHQTFFGVQHFKRNYYDEAVDLFTRKEEHPRNVDVRMFFDAERAKVPTIHITCPQDTSGDDSIGSEGSDFECDIVEVDGTITGSYTKRFDTVYQIILTSDNHAETLIMYHLLRAALISALDTVQLSGLQNAKFSGQELRIKENLAPEHIFMRGLSISCSYDITIPKLFSQNIISDILTKEYEFINDTISKVGVDNNQCNNC